MAAFTINFPPDLTQEEVMLKRVFERMRKIRKIVANAKAAGNAEKVEQPEKRVTSKRSIEDAQGATEEAKRKVASGALTITNVEKKQTFKRSKVLDRRIKDGDSASASYQPYSSSMLGDFAPDEILQPTPVSRRPTLYDNFVSGGGNDDEDEGSDKIQQRGSTIYVRGYDLVEDPLRHAFGAFGNIQRVHIEERKKSAFIEFDSPEQAEKAISEMNGNMVNGITLRVSLARRQNYHSRMFDSNPKQHAWSELVSGGGQGSRRRPEGRSMVSYDDADVF